MNTDNLSIEELRKCATCSFLSYLPYEKSDNEIINDALWRNSEPKVWTLSEVFNHFACIYYVGGIFDNNCYGNPFQMINLYVDNARKYETIFITRTTFNYSGRLTFDKVDEDKMSKSDFASKYFSLLNDRWTTLEQFSRLQGKTILMGYNFDIFNEEFNKKRTCYRFYTLPEDEKLKAEVIRNQILRAQIFILTIVR